MPNETSDILAMAVEMAEAMNDIGAMSDETLDEIRTIQIEDVSEVVKRRTTEIQIEAASATMAILDEAAKRLLPEGYVVMNVFPAEMVEGFEGPAPKSVKAFMTLLDEVATEQGCGNETFTHEGLSVADKTFHGFPETISFAIPS